MAKIIIKYTDQANAEAFKIKTEEFFKDKKGTVEVRKSAPNSFKIESREEFQKKYNAWLDYLSKAGIDISQIQLEKEVERSKTFLSMGNMTSKVDRMTSGITFDSLNQEFKDYKNSLRIPKPIKPPRKDTLEATKLDSTKLDQSIQQANEHTKLIETKKESLSVVTVGTVQEEPPPLGSVTSQSVGSGPQKSDVTTLEEIQSQAQELQNKINTLQRSDLLKVKEVILKQDSGLLEALGDIEGGDIKLKESIQALLNDNIQSVETIIAQQAIKDSKQRPPPPSRAPTGPSETTIRAPTGPSETTISDASLSSSKIYKDLLSSIEQKRLADQALELYEKNIISPQKKVVSEKIQNALELIKSNFNSFDSRTTNATFLDLIDEYFDEINPNALEDDLDVEIEDFNKFHQKTLSNVDKMIVIVNDPTERSKLSMKIGDLKIKNRLEIYINALSDYISYLFSGSVEKKKFNDFVKYYENNLEERVISERIKELKEQKPELQEQINRISETVETLKKFIDEQKNPGSKSTLALSDKEKILKLEYLDKVLLEKKSDFYAVIETLQSHGINILEINYSDYVKWKELELRKDNLDLFEFPLRGAGVLEELKYVAQLLNDVKKIINNHDQSQGKAQEIYEKIIKGKKITLGQLRYSSLYNPITKEEFNHLLENLKTIISENESPREKLIRLLYKKADTEILSQSLQDGVTINIGLLNNISLNIEQFKEIIQMFIKDLTKTPTSAELGIDVELYQMITSSSPSPVSPIEDSILVELDEIRRQALRVQEGISQPKNESISQPKYLDSKLQQENDRLLSLIQNEKYLGRDISSIQTLLESNKAKISKLIPPPPPSAPPSSDTVNKKPPPPTTPPPRTQRSINESPREKLIRLLDKKTDTERLSQSLQDGVTINMGLLNNISLNIEQFKEIIQMFIKDLTKTPTSAELGIDDGLYQMITSSSPSPVSPIEDSILVELDEIRRQALRVQEGISQPKNESISQPKNLNLSKLQQENNRLLSLIQNEKYTGRDISSIQTLLESNKATISKLIPPPPPSAPVSSDTVSKKPPPPPPQGQPSTPVTPPVYTRPFGIHESLLKQIKNPPTFKKTVHNPPPPPSIMDELKKNPPTLKKTVHNPPPPPPPPSTQRSRMMDEIKNSPPLRATTPPSSVRTTTATSPAPINKHGLFGEGNPNTMLIKAQVGEGNINTMLKKAQDNLSPVSSELEKCATITMNSDGSKYELILYIDKNDNNYKYYLYNGVQSQENSIGGPLYTETAVISACQNFYREKSCSKVTVNIESNVDLFDFNGGNASYFQEEILKSFTSKPR